MPGSHLGVARGASVKSSWFAGRCTRNLEWGPDPAYFFQDALDKAKNSTPAPIHAQEAQATDLGNGASKVVPPEPCPEDFNRSRCVHCVRVCVCNEPTVFQTSVPACFTQMLAWVHLHSVMIMLCTYTQVVPCIPQTQCTCWYQVLGCIDPHAAWRHYYQQMIKCKTLITHLPITCLISGHTCVSSVSHAPEVLRYHTRKIPMHWSSCDTSNNTIAHGSYTSLHGRSELEFYLMHIGYSTSVMSPLVTWVSSWSANLFYYRTCTQVKARVPGAWPARSWCVIPWDAFYKNMKTSVVCLWRFWKVTLTVWPRV